MALTELATVKAELGLTGTDSDTLLTRYINEASAAIEGFCNRVFGTQGYVDTFRQPCGVRRLILSASPVTAVASAVEDGVALTAADYELSDAAAGFLDRLDGEDGLSWWAAAKIVVTFTAGYVMPGSDGRNLPYDVEGACIELVKARYHAQARDPALRSEDVDGVYAASYREGFTPGSLPKEVRDILARHRRLAVP